MNAPPITAEMLVASMQRLRARGVVGPLVLRCISAHAPHIRGLVIANKLKLRVLVDDSVPMDELRVNGLKPKAQPMARPAARRPSRAQPFYRQFERRRR
jgi:hypothetical protein